MSNGELELLFVNHLEKEIYNLAKNVHVAKNVHEEKPIVGGVVPILLMIPIAVCMYMFWHVLDKIICKTKFPGNTMCNIIPGNTKNVEVSDEDSKILDDKDVQSFYFELKGITDKKKYLIENYKKYFSFFKNKNILNLLTRHIPTLKTKFPNILGKGDGTGVGTGGKIRTRRRSNKKRTNKRKKTKTRMKRRKTSKRKTNKRRRKR